MVDDYSVFKRDLLLKTNCFSLEALKTVVNEYASVINSKRQSSCIKNFDELVLILEKRCHICPEDYSNLENIVNYLPERDKNIMLARLNHQTTNIFGDEFSNNNGTPNTSSCPPRQTQEAADCQLPESVLTLVSNEIGIKWRDLARKLELREGELMSIERQYPNDIKMCAYESLKMYQLKSKKHNLKRNLLQALGKARRRDLQKEVQDIFDSIDS